MVKRLLLVGGGGHCGSVLDSVLAAGLYDDIGIIDYEKSKISGVPVVGTDEDLPRLKKEGWTDAFVSMGSVGNTAIRRRLYTMLKEIGFAIPTIIDPASTLARDVVINEGCFVGKQAVINSGVIAGICGIVNTGAIIEHNCILGAFSHVSPGAIICGQVIIGDDSHIGAGSVIRQQITIGKHVLIGAGSVVVCDMAEGVKAYGNPCRVVD